MKKTIACLAVLFFVQVSAALAQPSQPLADFFAEVVAIEGAASAGQWGKAEMMADDIKSKMLGIAPSVRSAIGEHSYKALLGFVVQLQAAVQEKNSRAAAAPIVSLQKMHDWLSQVPSGS